MCSRSPVGTTRPFDTSKNVLWGSGSHARPTSSRARPLASASGRLRPPAKHIGRVGQGAPSRGEYAHAKCAGRGNRCRAGGADALLIPRRAQAAPNFCGPRARRTRCLEDSQDRDSQRHGGGLGALPNQVQRAVPAQSLAVVLDPYGADRSRPAGRPTTPASSGWGEAPSGIRRRIDARSEWSDRGMVGRSSRRVRPAWSHSARLSRQWGDQQRWKGGGRGSDGRVRG